MPPATRQIPSHRLPRPTRLELLVDGLVGALALLWAAVIFGTSPAGSSADTTSPRSPRPAVMVDGPMPARSPTSGFGVR